MPQNLRELARVLFTLDYWIDMRKVGICLKGMKAKGSDSR
jgi:hypothetical protein